MKLFRTLLAALTLLAPTLALAEPAFAPITDSTIAVSASTSNANGTLRAAPSGGIQQVRVYNACSTAAFIRFGGTATTSSVPIPAGVVEVMTVQPYETTVGVILASGSGCSVYFTLGSGV